MPGLISSDEAVGLREALSIFFVHTCTRTPMVSGAEDNHGNASVTPGVPVAGVACKYKASDRVRADIDGALILRAPTLSVAHDSPLTEGDEVSNVLDSEGVVLLAGPVTVGPAVHSAGFGPTLKKRFVLRGVEVTL